MPRFEDHEYPPYPTLHEDMPILAYSALFRYAQIFPKILQRCAQGELEDSSIYAIDTATLDEDQRVMVTCDPAEAYRLYQKPLPESAPGRLFCVEASLEGRRVRAGITQTKRPCGEWFPMYTTLSYVAGGNDETAHPDHWWNYELYDVPAALQVSNDQRAYDVQDHFMFRYVGGQAQLVKVFKGHQENPAHGDYLLNATANHDNLNMETIYASYLPELTSQEWQAMALHGARAVFFCQTCRALGNLSAMAGEDPAQPFGPSGSPYDVYRLSADS